MCMLGRAYQFEGNFEEAERCLQQAADADAKSDLSRLYLGQIALQRGRLDEARKLLEQASSLVPERYETMYNLALAYRRLGRTSDANRLSKKAEERRKAIESR
jgi:tetratricopeptide (TPR) repeat protein